MCDERQVAQKRDEIMAIIWIAVNVVGVAPAFGNEFLIHGASARVKIFPRQSGSVAVSRCHLSFLSFTVFQGREKRFPSRLRIGGSFGQSLAPTVSVDL